MCIRDSVEDQHGPGRVARRLEGVEVTEVEALVPQRRPEACLLYTSDAADERSSVDLGGRRIIQKKKQEPDDGLRHYTEQRANTTHDRVTITQDKV